MQTLSVLSVEDGAIVVASPSGERFRLPVDAALRAELLSVPGPVEERRLSPREIQAHVRSGLSAEQVAALTGVPVASIERFVGPVLAERAYIVESALAVRLPPETEGARSRTFGAVMGERLDALAAREVRWSSAKEPTGWILAVRFTADDTAHDARWRFDAKHMRLDADNVEASTLSQQGVPAALTPRLRAIEPTAPIAIVAQAPTAMRRAPEPAQTDTSRFDSAAFRFPPAALAADEAAPAPAAPAARRRSRSTGPRTPAAAPPEAPAAEAAAPAVEEPLPETRAMDLLPAPRGRTAPPVGEVFAPRPSPTPPAARQHASVTPLRSRHADPTPVEDRPTEPLRRRRERTQPQQTVPVPPAPEPAQAQQDDDRATARARRGRTSMPSWDEIVFGRDETP